MAKPFKNLSAPAANTNESAPSPKLQGKPTLGDLSVNEERVNDGLRDGDTPLVRIPVDNGTKPMRLKGE